MAVRLCEPPARAKRAGISIGADSRYVFCDLLGMPEKQLAAYTNEGPLDGEPGFQAFMARMRKERS